MNIDFFVAFVVLEFFFVFCVFLSARDIQVVRLMTLIADVVYMNQASSRVFEEELLLLKVLLHILESAVVD